MTENGGQSHSDLKLVILDQNAVSNLALAPDRIWSEILDLLKSGVKAEKIICPTPIETISETIHLPRSARERIEELSDELSKGFFVKFFWQLLAQEILATVRPETNTFPLWIPEERQRAIDENETLKNAQTILKEKTDFEMEVNLEALPPKSREFTVKDFQYLAVSSWFDLMRSYLNKFRNGQMIGNEQFVIQQTLHTLNELNITDKEIAALLRGIQERSWLEIPLVFSWLFLDGILLYDVIQRGRKYEYNDEWDKFRAAAAYHIAHCFITDGGIDLTPMSGHIKSRVLPLV